MLESKMKNRNRARELYRKAAALEMSCSSRSDILSKWAEEEKLAGNVEEARALLKEACEAEGDNGKIPNKFLHVSHSNL
jgi:tetratricopeptide (TPR) repeat protein